MTHAEPLSRFDRELTVAIQAARDAGAAMMPYYGNVTAEQKSDTSPVTAADHASNHVILNSLQDAFPECAILSEESKDHMSRLTCDQVWIVDPLDGTKEFLAQNGEFSVMIGLAEYGRPVLGVVYLPASDILYFAALGKGAWKDASGTRERLRCVSFNEGALRFVGSRSHPDPLLIEMQERLGIDDVVPCGSVGVKCARIAEGDRDLYIHPVPYLKEWDTCAPEIILREADGLVTDCLGNPLRYNKGEPVQPDGIFASGSGRVTHLMNRVRSIYTDRARLSS